MLDFIMSLVMSFFASFLISSIAIAQEAGPQGPQGPGGLISMFAHLGIVFIIFYVLIFRPQQKQQKEREAMLGRLGRGDEVVTNSGIYGKITDLTDTFVMLQIANNVIVKVDRAQVGTVVSASK